MIPKSHDANKRRYVVVSDDGLILGPEGHRGLHLVFDTQELAGESLVQSRARVDGRIVAVRLEPIVQRACDRCSQGVMDADNSHLRGLCRCECHGAQRP